MHRNVITWGKISYPPLYSHGGRANLWWDEESRQNLAGKTLKLEVAGPRTQTPDVQGN
jgi:hypothetical protein